MIRSRTPIAVLAVALLVCVATTTSAQTDDDPILVIEVWSELDPLVADGGERPVPREVAVERLLEEATFVLSGMIYGFSFRYVPADPARDVDEVFELEPHAIIVRGDPSLEVFQTWVDEGRLYARIFYTVHGEQSSWYRGWQSAANAVSTGVGTAPFVSGPSVKPEATRDAIRVAIRNHARRLEFNRPQLVTGAVLISRPPEVGVREGNYEARVSVRLQIDSIERYEIY